ncbi:MAG: AI-2E family transporter [Bauldia sp.]|nr:AI-2E family transporter [Bauldia sp.]
MTEPDRRISFDGVLAAIVVGLLLIATALTLKPFLPAILWSIVLAVTAAPLHGRTIRWMPGRRRLAALITTLLLVVILVVPALGLTRAVIAYTPGILGWVDQFSTTRPVATAPQSIRNIPLVGGLLSSNWEIVSGHISAYVAHFKADIEEWLIWGLQEMETVGVFIFEFGLAVVLAGVFLANEARLSGFANVFFQRIGGGFGVELLHKSVQTTRSTVRGVVGTAVAEALVAMLAYFIAGVPAWLLLGGLTFFAALVQIGAPLVWIPVALWLLVQEEPGWAIFMVVWGVVVINAVENLSRPLLVSRSTHLPGLLIFVGVLGGLFAWGLIGVFLGPVILAVAYELIQVWFRSAEAEEAGAAPAPEPRRPKPAK